MTNAPTVVESFVPAATTVVAPTDVLSRYTRCKVLRVTPYGETALYQDSKYKKLVVLKRLSIALLQRDDKGSLEIVKENPLNERAVIQLLDDPLTAHAPGREYVVEYKREGFFTIGDNIFIAMDFCAGGDLYDYITAKSSRRLPEAEALWLFAQIASGLNFLHAIGVAHRDLSLENVLLKDGNVRICDFGLSADANLFSTDVVGKFYYMAPEVTQGVVYDPKCADIWSLGILLFIMLTGSPLFADEDARAPTFRVLNKYGVCKILELWGLKEYFSNSTITLLASMLQVQPSRRLTAKELAHCTLLRGLSTCARLSSVASTA
ncbi:camk camkl protein kinase [Plasmopara halstedii]|uniref:non-specific serine/threonine protein kinase n=1 Tax=Plasmopara halstedii TaxID=4781 RepID=A0A0P1A961_PLAHL|nr:camk camkl protein kinase [Plasmopara halstedii]CEG37258.1 camk camkl protein kinase [Plasmopara halstedii]|eukprot:XP_024573627.1 camk camkl protein kinase [Plasmopara halstedii]